jgi:hypothetical protein
MCTTIRKTDGLQPLEPIDCGPEDSPGGIEWSEWVLVGHSREAVRCSLPTVKALNRPISTIGRRAVKPTDYDEIAGIAIVYGVAAFRHMHELGKPAMKTASGAGIT